MMKKQLPLLVVDDRWLMRQTIISALNDMGYIDLVEASNGLEAMRILQSKVVAAIIADWNMPGLNGLGLLRWLRSKPELASIPFMMIAAESSREMVRTAIESGVSAYMVKPFTVQDLANKVERLLGQNTQALPVRSGDKVLGLTEASDVEARVENSTILVVDDISSNSEIIAEILKEHYTIKTVHSGADAIEIAHSPDQPDLILLDIMMPGINGYDVCKHLKEHPDTQNIPIIFLTSNDEVQDIVKGFELGAVDYITKPAEPAILKARVSTHLRLKQAFFSLTQQNASLVSSAKLKEDIDRITQHDLKNPLSAIILSSDQMLKDPNLHPEVKKSFQQIHLSAWHTLDLINQSLSLYQLETGSFTLKAEPVDIAATLIMIRKETLTAFSERHLDIRLSTQDGSKLGPGQYIIQGERGLCYSLFMNLVRNAAEASMDHDMIHISFGIHADSISVTIHNSLPVPVDMRECFFGKYTTSGKKSGTGLGTYTAKLVAEAMHGIIHMITDETTGTIITVHLPKAPTPTST